MAKVPSDSISAFRSAADIESSNPALQTIADLEARVQELTGLLLERDQQIAKLQKGPPSFQDLPPAPPSSSLEKLRAQLEAVERERDELKRKYRDALQKLHTSYVDPKEYRRLKAEVLSLKELQQARLRAEREDERDRLHAELKDQVGGWQRMFTCLERLAIKTASTLADHAATSEDERDLARQLRTKPDELRSYLSMGEISYQDAFEELAPILHAAASKIAETKKLGLPVTRIEHRARILLETLRRMDRITTADAIKIIFGDEGHMPKREQALRAMRKAAQLEPHRAIFVKGSNGDLSELKRKGGDW
jgi:hypothetical protein